MPLSQGHFRANNTNIRTQPQEMRIFPLRGERVESTFEAFASNDLTKSVYS